MLHWPLLNKLKGRQLLLRVIGNSAWQVSDKVIRMGVGLVVHVWVARYLGSGDFGLLNFAIAFMTLFSPLADLGMQIIVVRELVNRAEQRAVILASALAVRLSGSLIATALSVAAIFLLRQGDTQSQIVVTFVALSLIAQSWDVIDYDYQARMRVQAIVLIRIVSFLTFAIVKVVLIRNSASVEAFAIAFSGESALTAALFVGVARRHGISIKLGDSSAHEVRRLVTACWPLMIAALSIMLYMRIDQVMLGQMVNDVSVGILTAATKVSEAWYFVPTAVTAALAPALFGIAAHSTDQVEQRLLKAMRALNVLAIGVAVALTLLSGNIISLLYGPEYEAAAWVLTVHAWGGVFVALGAVAGPWFVQSGLLKIRMLYSFGGALLNICLNLVLIPRYRELGAAIATVISYSFTSFLLNGMYRKTRPLFRLQMRSLLWN